MLFSYTDMEYTKCEHSLFLVITLLGFCRCLSNNILPPRALDPAENEILNTDIICKTYPGLTHGQYKFCKRNPEATAAAIQGLQLAVQECQLQFKDHRWNCSNLQSKHGNPFYSTVLTKGYRESAFAHAILSAGMMTEISRACALGNLRSCGCQPEVDYDSGLWKWSNCETNLAFADRFTRRFLDKRKLAKDLTFLTHFHNSRVGRKIVKSQSHLHCKCHGMSGSCQVRTCWKVAPMFKKVGFILKQKYHQAVVIDGANSVQVKLTSSDKDLISGTDLVYFDKSPNFCEPDSALDLPGTHGRHCSRASYDTGGCEPLCCGRGYNMLSMTVTEQCHCQFQWCCQVVCETCVQSDWVTVCK